MSPAGLAAVAAGLVICAGPLAAQEPSPADPIRCWWRTSQGAVAIGEPFEATLTCAVRDQDTTRTVPDESRLSAATIQLSPFEVLQGSHPPDLRSSTHRFLQYHYTLRIIDRDVIGHDARFPDLQIAYRVHTRVNGEWSEGRDRSYVMPGRQVRVLSLVPVEADDIRDSGDESFARVAALRFRSRALNIAAVALIVLGALTAVPSVARLIRARRAPGTSDERKASRRNVLATVDKELAAVATDARGGWTPDLASRALNALRLVASCALGRDVSSRPGNARTAGWLTVPDGLFGRQKLAISSPVTALDVRQAVAALPMTTPYERQQALEGLADAMDAFTHALYSTRFDPADGALEAALSSGRALTPAFRRQA